MAVPTAAARTPWAAWTARLLGMWSRSLPSVQPALTWEPPLPTAVRAASPQTPLRPAPTPPLPRRAAAPVRQAAIGAPVDRCRLHTLLAAAAVRRRRQAGRLLASPRATAPAARTCRLCRMTRRRRRRSRRCKGSRPLRRRGRASSPRLGTGRTPRLPPLSPTWCGTAWASTRSRSIQCTSRRRRRARWVGRGCRRPCAAAQGVASAAGCQATAACLHRRSSGRSKEGSRCLRPLLPRAAGGPGNPGLGAWLLRSRLCFWRILAAPVGPAAHSARPLPPLLRAAVHQDQAGDRCQGAAGLRRAAGSGPLQAH